MTRLSGGLIDRGRSLRFRFDGKEYQGHPGDTLASALIANGVSLVGRSFKYHRPRGIVTAGPDNRIRVVDRDGTPRPYVHVRGGLDALIDRKTFYRLVEAARPGDDGRLVLRSSGATFLLEG